MTKLVRDSCLLCFVRVIYSSCSLRVIGHYIRFTVWCSTIVAADIYVAVFVGLVKVV